MPYASALFRNGRAVQQEIIKGLEKELGIGDEKESAWRRER